MSRADRLWLVLLVAILCGSCEETAGEGPGCGNEPPEPRPTGTGSFTVSASYLGPESPFEIGDTFDVAEGYATVVYAFEAHDVAHEATYVRTGTEVVFDY